MALSKEEKLALLESRKKEQDALSVSQQRDEARWKAEIAMLERRVKEETVQIDLGGGDKISLRACLSDREMAELGDLQKKWGNPKIKQADQEETTYRMLELTTANPIMTAEWFREKRDRYATNDMLTVIIGFFETKLRENKERMDRVSRAASFRPDESGSGIRGLPAPSGNPGSEGVRGSPTGD